MEYGSRMNTEALMEAEAAEAMAARKLLDRKGVRVDAALQTDLEDYRLARARAEEMRRVMFDHMAIAGEREWGPRDHKTRGGARAPTTRSIMQEIAERNKADASA